MTKSISILSLFFAFLLLSQQSHVLAQAKPKDDWKLVWSDEFEGKSLDYSKWEIEVNAFGGGNQELQLYTDKPKNVRVENGNLVLEAHREKAEMLGTERPFSSGRVRSKRRGDWKYGRFVFRAKLPEGQGLWPAIWMLPSDDRYGRWALSGEIDIVEVKGHEPNKIYGTLHFGDSWPKNRHAGETYVLPKGNFADSFHEFAFEWEAKEMRWYVDGKHFLTQNHWDSEGNPFPAPFDQDFHLILNLAVGGGFGGPVGDNVPFPKSLLIDYVRVFQKGLVEN